MARIGMTLAAYKAQSIVRLDAAFEQFRMQFITPGSGQALAYMTKLREAEAYLAPGGENLSPFEIPHLVSESAVDNMTLLEKAQQIVTISYEWGYVSSKIDALRLARKQAIDVAATPAEIRTLMQIDWESILNDPAHQ